MDVDLVLLEQMNAAFKHHQESSEPSRSHLGASQLGKTCPRELWYDFRRVNNEELDGRMHRLLDRGQREEERFIHWLELADVDVHALDEQGRQYRCTAASGHSGGSLDAVLLNTPRFGNQPALGEMKTHKDSSFRHLQNKGVREAKWLHYVQMQLYMGAYDLAGAYYLAINKDTDALHVEVVPRDYVMYDAYKNRAWSIVYSEDPPQRAADSPSRYACTFCIHKRMCFHGGHPKVRLCRNCEHGYPKEDTKGRALWGCRYADEHPEKDQCNLENRDINWETKRTLLEVD